MEFLKRQPHKHFLLITPIPAHFTIYEMGALDFDHSNRMKESILGDFKNRLFEEIYVIQDIQLDTQQPTKKNILDKAYILEPLTSLRNEDNTYIQISRVKHP